MASQKGTLVKYWRHCIIVGNVQSRLHATIGRASSNDLILSWKLVYCPTVAYRLVAIAEPCTIVATATTARMLLCVHPWNEERNSGRGLVIVQEPSVPINCDGSRGLDMNKEHILSCGVAIHRCTVGAFVLRDLASRRFNYTHESIFKFPSDLTTAHQN